MIVPAIEKEANLSPLPPPTNLLLLPTNGPVLGLCETHNANGEVEYLQRGGGGEHSDRSRDEGD